MRGSRGVSSLAAGRRAALVALGLSLTLSAGLITAVDAVPAPAAAATTTATSSKTMHRETVGAAMTAAVATKSPVVVDALTTPQQLITAYPDGSLHAEQDAGPTRVQQGDGSWAPVDLNLAVTNGVVAPKMPAVPFALSAGGDATVATEPLGSGVGQLVWGGGVLPAPVVSGTTATYPDVQPGVDLVVRALRTGLEVNFVVKTAPAGALSLRLTLQTTGLTTTQRTDGGLSLVDAKGRQVGDSSAPVMWDASTTPGTNYPARQAPVATQLGTATSGSLTPVTVPAPVGDVRESGAAAVSSWTVSPDPSFLADPATVFPVTVDPSLTLKATTDTYIDQANRTTSYYSATSLYIGTDGNIKRAYIGFPAPSGLSGMYVDSANVQLYNTYSASCAASSTPVSIRGLGAAFSSSTTWNTRISSYWNSGQTFTSNFAYAGPTCTANGWGIIDVTPLAQSWADGSNTLYQIEVTGSESSTLGYKAFNSSEDSMGVPTFYAVYRAFPWTPRKTSVAPGAVVSSTLYVGSTTPTVAPVIADATGNQVRTHLQVWNSTHSTKLWEGYGAYGAPGARSPGVQVPSGTLSNGSTYQFQVWGNDGVNDSKASTTVTGTVDTTIPTVSGLSCPGLTLNGFTSSAPGSTTPCTASASSGTSGLKGAAATLDGAPLTTSVAGGTVSFTLPAGMTANQWHQLTVSATSNVGTPGTNNAVRFGFGSGVIDTQAPGDPSSSSIPVTVQAAAGVGVVLQYWNPTTSTWATIPNGDLTTATGGSVTQPLSVSTSGSTVSTAQYTWKLASTYAWDTVGQVRACLQLVTGADCATTTNTAFTPGNQVTLDRSGAGSASTTAGPFTISLATGAVSLAESDASLPSWAGAASVGRSYLSYKATTDSPFGLGWSSTLPSAAGTDWTKLTDAGSYVLVYDSSATPIAFTKTGSTYTPDADNTDLSLTYTAGGTGTYATFTLSEQDGTTSTFTYPTTGTAPTGTAATPTAYPFTSSANTNLAGSTSTYTTDATGNVTRILAPLPSGVAATSCAAGSMSAWIPGCADLVLTYDTNHHVTTITQRGYTQATGGSGAAQTKFTADVACYAYDGGGHLIDQWDAREQTTSTGSCSYTNRVLDTQYGYDGSGRLTSITPPGVQPWTLTYDTSGRAATVSRTHAGGGPITTTLGYAVNVGAATGSSDDTHPDLTATAIATWAPAGSLAPVTATAIWAPGGSTSDLRDAAITALDAQGRTVFTAGFSGTGQAGWRVTTSHYDVNGNPDWSLTGHDRDVALDATTYAADWAALGWTGNASITSTVAADALASKTVYAQLAADGVWDATDKYGPTHLITVAGITAPGRTHTHTTYGTSTATTAPTDVTVMTTAPTHTALSTTVGATAGASITGADYATVSTTTNAYGIPNGSGGYLNAGWLLRTPMQVTTAVPGGTDIVSQTVVNSSGQVTEQRQPSAANTSGTAGSRVTTYYGTGDNPNACQSTIWYGQVCKQGPAAGSEAVTTQTSYDSYQRPYKTDETMGGVTRTTTTVYRNSGQSSLVDTATVTGGTGTAVPTTTYAYDAAKGLVNSVSNGTVTMTRGYDDFGQVNATNDGAGGATTVTFDTAGRTSTVTGTQNSATVYSATYGYNAGTEHRGLSTSVTYGGLPGAITATYDGDGSITTQNLPEATGGGGTITETWTYDTAGQATNLAYTQGGISFGVNDNVDIDPAGHWVGEGQTAADWTRSYTYDGAGRLTGVTHDDGTSCVTRTYTFDVNSNRLAKTSYPDAGGTSTPTDTCQNSTGASTVSSTFDSADRATTLAGASMTGKYDTFGRVTSLTGAQTPTGTAVTALAYYTNDLAQYMTDGTTKKYWTLDPGNRLACRRSEPSATTDASACGATTTAGVTDTVNHYSDPGGDSPAWTVTDTGGSASTTSYATGLDGNLALQMYGSASTYQLGDLQGDIVASSSTSAVGSFDGTANVSDEYGLTTSTTRYGWLGGKQRPTDASAGLVLMGVRLYDAVSGFFLSLDPVYGGNLTPYGYPVDVPNGSDLSGRFHDNGRHESCDRTCRRDLYKEIRQLRHLARMAAFAAKHRYTTGQMLGQIRSYASGVLSNAEYLCRGFTECIHNAEIALSPFVVLGLSTTAVWGGAAICTSIIGCLAGAPAILGGFGGAYSSWVMFRQQYFDSDWKKHWA